MRPPDLAVILAHLVMIAGYTHGASLLGLVVRRANQGDAVAAFATVAAMAWAVRSHALAFTWYVPLGVTVTFAVGGLLSLTYAAPRLDAVPAARA